MKPATKFIYVRLINVTTLNVEANHATSLHEAKAENVAEAMELLREAYINAYTWSGFTCFEYVVQCEHSLAANMLKDDQIFILVLRDTPFPLEEQEEENND